MYVCIITYYSLMLLYYYVFNDLHAHNYPRTAPWATCALAMAPLPPVLPAPAAPSAASRGHGGAGGEQPQCQSRTPFSVALGDFLEKRRNMWVSS